MSEDVTAETKKPNTLVKLLLGLMLFFVIFILVGAGYYFFTKYFSPTKVTGGVQEYTIQIGDSNIFNSLLEEAGYTSSNRSYYDWDQGKWQKFSNVVINFTEKPQRFGRVIGAEKELLSSFGQNLNNGTLRLDIYVSPESYFEKKDIEEASVNALGMALLVSKSPDFYTNEETSRKVYEIIKKYILASANPLEISKAGSNLIKNTIVFFEKNNPFRVKSALAQTCSGTFECGQNASQFVCSDGSGASCKYTGQACGLGGVCYSATVCQEKIGGGATLCGNYFDCGPHCAPSECILNNSCSLGGGGPTPTPPPGGTIDCGTQTCNADTEVCCATGCKPISEGCTAPPPPLVSYQCTVQGYKVLMPGLLTGAPASSQTVTLNDPLTSTSAQPYFLYYQSAGKSRTVTVSVPPNYTVGYTLCYNNTGCHTSPPVMSNTVTLPDNSFCGSSAGFADLWWHFYPPPVANCKNLTGPSSLYVGEIGTFTATYEAGTGPITDGGLVIYNEGVCDPNTAPYRSTTAGGGTKSFNWRPSSPGTYDVDCRAWNDGITECRGRCYGTPPVYQCAGPTTTRKVTVLSPISAWWQVKDSDLLAFGDLDSSVPTSLYFNLVGGGGFPGVPVYSGSTNLTSTNVSVKKWLAKTYFSSKIFNFGSSYFINSIPSAATINNISSSAVPGSYFASGGTAYNGYYWYVYDGNANGGFNLTITSAAALGSRKVILIVKNAGLNVQGNINLTKGSGFFLAVTTGNIVVTPNVGGGASANLEGIYVADGTFFSGTEGAQADPKLWVRGTVAAYGGIDLQRNLGSTNNSTTPAEFFEYAPELELLFPIELSNRLTNWREVAP